MLTNDLEHLIPMFNLNSPFLHNAIHDFTRAYPDLILAAYLLSIGLSYLVAYFDGFYFIEDFISAGEGDCWWQTYNVKRGFKRLLRVFELLILLVSLANMVSFEEYWLLSRYISCKVCCQIKLHLKNHAWLVKHALRCLYLRVYVSISDFLNLSFFKIFKKL